MARIYKSFSTTSPNASANGNIYDMDVIITDITNLLKTRKGEYPMDLDRGCIAYDYVHEPELTELDKSEIINDVREQLLTDPRLNNIEVHIQTLSTGYYIMVNARVSPNDSEINLSVNIQE